MTSSSRGIDPNHAAKNHAAKEKPAVSLKDLIARSLEERLAPTHLVVTDESERHRGHAGWREGGETHFQVDIVSPAFEGKSRVERHRLVNDSLVAAFERGVHALAIKASAPGE
jgi:BolA protein